MVSPSPRAKFVPVEASETENEILMRSRPFTMASDQRVWASMSAAKYIVNNKVLGAVVECGVWRGGCSMAMMETVLSLGPERRDFFLFDTFEGMTDASEFDIDPSGTAARYLLRRARKTEGNNIWCIADFEDVKSNVGKTGYPTEVIHLIQGDVTKTLEIASNLPEKIALLRLDTDWYESTKKELKVLFPRLVKGGICIVDDYGHWSGARKAVDDYLQEIRLTPLVHVTDYTGRVFVKP